MPLALIFFGVMSMKTKKRKVKEAEYQNKYSDIPKDFQERLYWMYDQMKFTEKKQKLFNDKKERMLQELKFTELFVVLYEVPEGTPRPRFRLINRKNIGNAAMSNSQFVHVYSVTGDDDGKYMQRLVDEGELLSINRLIYTPCEVEYAAYLPTPKAFNQVDTFLAETGYIRPLPKPDWDNIGKKYSDMYNSRVWLDDSLVIKGTVSKYYSILPRVEIKLRYLNMLYNRYQYKSIVDRVDEGEVKYFE